MNQNDIGSYRIADHPVFGRAPKGEIVAVTVDGREMQGIVGEPIAAMLLAHGIRTFRTQPETGTPRGLFSGVGRSGDELMVVNDEPNVMVTTTPLEAGMTIETQQGLGE